MTTFIRPRDLARLALLTLLSAGMAVGMVLIGAPSWLTVLSVAAFVLFMLKQQPFARLRGRLARIRLARSSIHRDYFTN